MQSIIGLMTQETSCRTRLDIQNTVTRLLSLWCMQTSADRLATGKAEIDGINIEFARPSVRSVVATDHIPFLPHLLLACGCVGLALGRSPSIFSSGTVDLTPINLERSVRRSTNIYQIPSCFREGAQGINQVHNKGLAYY
jgi:hypothetical protein